MVALLFLTVDLLGKIPLDVDVWGEVHCQEAAYVTTTIIIIIAVISSIIILTRCS